MLASRLLGAFGVTGVRFAGDGVTIIDTLDAAILRRDRRRRTGRAAFASTRSSPLDDDLESVFRYLQDGS